MRNLASTQTFSIRKARPADADGILDCLLTAFFRYRKQYTPEAFADTVLNVETLRSRMREMCVFVAVAGEDIVGTIGCRIDGREGHLRGMAVLPEWQGEGVALGLLRAAEGELQARGCDHVTLDTTEPLRRAVRFYEKHGFKPTGRVSDFFGMKLFEYSKPLTGGL